MHAMNEAFHDDDVQAVLLVDASNAFNCLNREAALRNIRHLCPPLSTILINTYRKPTNLYMDGHILLSQEGTTQGDPLAMPMYAIGICPLIHKVSCDVQQVWYADDATASGQLKDLRQWWDNLVIHGPDFGYFANPSKTSLRNVTIWMQLHFLKTQMLASPQMVNRIWEQLWEQRHLFMSLSMEKYSNG